MTTLFASLMVLLLSGGLLVVTTTQIQQPLNLMIDGGLILILWLISIKFFNLISWFSLLYIIFMLAVVLGLYAYRNAKRGS